ncbi:hypothetical protein Micbo1qcDRAFT_168499 [Microdochium bolleyi]|uniref:Uncharacterized protein n=1 Tax=Microdochium bolleyi TaxID=196109 RepID=A0A136INH9_9PEZI|nr:hypothetical protein Micbo1qcDRAFT_168499 [Microdochium bolleyi]
MPVDPTLAAMGACRERVAIAGWGETVYALVIALPVLGLCLIAGSCTWFWCRRARRSRVARAAPVQLLVGGEKRIQDANQQ